MADRPGLLGTPLGQFGLGALALVVGGALLFTLIGAVSGTDGADTGQAATTSTPTDGGSTAAPSTSAPTSGESTSGTEAPTTPVSETTTTEPTPSETTTPPSVDTSVTIQVLNGSDDAADHDAVVACLREAGYDDLITSNRARATYASTTVFYTAGEGNQETAEQVARVLGIGSVEEQPGNLSESVAVHVVTGQDGTDLC